MIDLVALASDASVGASIIVAGLASGLVIGAIAVALTLVYGRE